MLREVRKLKEFYKTCTGKNYIKLVQESIQTPKQSIMVYSPMTPVGTFSSKRTKASKEELDSG